MAGLLRSPIIRMPVLQGRPKDEEVGRCKMRSRQEGSAGRIRRTNRVLEGSGRGERSQTTGTDLFVPVAWPLPVRLG